MQGIHAVRYLSALAIVAVLVMIAGGCGGSNSTSTSAAVTVPEVCEELTGGELVACEDGAAAAEEGEGVIATNPAEEEAEQQEEETDAEETSGSPIVGELTESASIRLRSTEGYTGLIALERGSIEHAQPGTINGEAIEGSACEINPETDAVVPYKLSVQNTTKGYTASPVATLHITSLHGAGEEPDADLEIGYTEGPMCGNENGTSDELEEGEGNLINLGPLEPLKSFSTTTAEGFVILEDFYSPAHPSGNRDQYAGMLLTLEAGYTEEGFVGTSSTGFTEKSETESVSDPSEYLTNSWPLLP